VSTPGPRKEVGDAASSSLHPPHTDVNSEGAPLQAETQAPNAVPASPANAHGEDRGAGQGPGHIDDESAYDRRPGEHKDRDETDMP